MRIQGYIFAAAAATIMAGTLIWAMGTEETQAVTHLAEADGFRFATAAPSEHGALAPCVACHRVEPRGPERSAPPLVGIVGAPVAAAPWFGYSPALARKGGTWSREELDTYLANPVAEVPGTFKTLSPIVDETTRNAILDALDRL